MTPDSLRDADIIGLLWYDPKDPIACASSLNDELQQGGVSNLEIIGILEEMRDILYDVLPQYSKERNYLPSLFRWFYRLHEVSRRAADIKSSPKIEIDGVKLAVELVIDSSERLKFFGNSIFEAIKTHWSKDTQKEAA